VVMIEKKIAEFWDEHLYERLYRNRSINNRVVVPSLDQLRSIYTSMHKYSKADIYDCNSCGYGSCENMAIAIFNGLNSPRNCHFYLATEATISHSKVSENEKRLRMVLHDASVGFCFFDNDYKVILVNPRFCELMGVGKEKLLGGQMFKKYIMECITGPSNAIEFRVNMGNGTVVSCLFCASVYKSETAQHSGYFAFVTDVSRFRKMP
jgi:PAS domain S-box-containing protein